MKKLVIRLCLIVLVVSSLYANVSVAELSSSVGVQVVDSGGVPIANAFVTLWDHDSTPSRLVTEARTDDTGVAKLVLPSVKDRTASRHFSVLASAAGHDVASWHWSEDPKPGTSLIQREGNRQTQVIVALNNKKGKADRSFMVGQSRSGMIRHSLVWWDYSTHTNVNTTVGHINQVGWMETSFTFTQRVDTRIGVAVKGELGPWTPSGSIRVNNAITSQIGWSLPATQNDGVYWQRRCDTQFDYRLEQYAIEEYQDNGDIQQWVRIGTQYKFYAQRLAPNATPAGSTYQIGNPQFDASWTGNYFTPQGFASKMTAQADEVGLALQRQVLFAQVSIGLTHTSGTTSHWYARNTAPIGGRKYELGVGFNKVWFFRPVY